MSNLNSLKYYMFALCLSLAAGLTVVAAPVMAQAGDVAMAAQAQTVNINAADAASLAETLVGVGQSRAEAIVRYREEFGPFFTIEDLMQVKGIGPAVVEKNRERITLE